MDVPELQQGDEGAATAARAYPGFEVFGWLVDEYERHHRGPIWFAVAVSAGLGLVLYALLAQNFLFAVIVLMFGVIIGLSTMREPQRLEFVVTTAGIAVGGRFVRFKDIQSFWILYEPPDVKNIYFEYKRSVRPHIVIPIYDQDPVAVRAELLKYIPEDLNQEEEPLTDILGRLLKL